MDGVTASNREQRHLVLQRVLEMKILPEALALYKSEEHSSFADGALKK